MLNYSDEAGLVVPCMQPCFDSEFALHSNQAWLAVHACPWRSMHAARAHKVYDDQAWLAAAALMPHAGLVHVLGDAFPLLMDPCLGLSSTYPWACAFAGLAVLLTFTLEFGLNKCFQAWAARNSAEDASEAAQLEAQKSLQRRRCVAASITFESGVIFHSVFIGISLGITPNVDTARTLAIALSFHQGFEGVALGTTMIKAHYSRLNYALCALLFVMITPIGIAIGTAVGASYQTESKLALGFEGGFDSASAGMLIYNAIADIILPTFVTERSPRSGGCRSWASSACMWAAPSWASSASGSEQPPQLCLHLGSPHGSMRTQHSDAQWAAWLVGQRE